LTLLHKHCNEPLIAYRYQVGQGDSDHMDALDYEDPRIFEAGGQRVVSIMIFLNDVSDGGAVRFDAGQFEVEPRAGDALYWWNASPNGLPDPASLYKSAPVKSGEKWILMSYVRASSFSGPDDRD
jgi:prolyl 4-hydroxylase